MSLAVDFSFLLTFYFQLCVYACPEAIKGQKQSPKECCLCRTNFQPWTAKKKKKDFLKFSNRFLCKISYPPPPQKQMTSMIIILYASIVYAWKEWTVSSTVYFRAIWSLGSCLCFSDQLDCTFSFFLLIFLMSFIFLVFLLFLHSLFGCVPCSHRRNPRR